MTDSTEKLQHELQAAQRALAEVRARCEHHDAERQVATKELEENRSALLFMLEDLKAGRKKIEQAHREWMAALDVVEDLIFLHDKQFRILRCNKAYQRCAGIPFHEIIGRLYYEIFPKTGAPLAGCLRAMEKVEEAAEAEEVVVGDTIYRSRAFSIHDEQGVHLYSAHTLEDITESRRAEAALHESEEKFRKISVSAQDGIIMMADKRISFWNAAAERIFGYTAAEALGQELHALIAPPPASAGLTQAFPHFQQSGEGPVVGKVIEVIALRKGGEAFPAELSVSAVQFGGQWHAIGIVRDITQRKQAEAVLRASENKNRTLLENLPQKIFYKDVNSAYISCNKHYADDLRIKPDEIPGKTDYEFYPAELAEKYRADDKRLMELNKAEDIEEKYIRDGQEAWVHTVKTPIKDDSGNVIGILGIFWDITEHKQAEAAIQHANRALATLSAVNRTLVRATNEDELLQAICDVIVGHGYRMVWVGYKQHDESKSIRIMARAGHDAGYLDAAQISWAENERGMGPSGRAMRSGATQLCQDMANDALFLQWRDAALKRGYAASIGLPLLEADGTVFGILNVYATETNAFTPKEIDLLEEMAGDLAFGVRGLHTRHERDLALEQSRRHLEKLRNSLEDTVRAMAGLVEMRDPYTAGHQARVADLAAAIARQMGLPEEQIHAIHIAGVVHDLGKIQIPAEILSKPGKITDLEFSLIKIHPQAGYDILKGIDFPWPIAQMVLQHHERLDGSGYPQGLKGEATLLEARILSVADVVEAIFSHRPYRAGLGIEIALEEITKNRGKFYDPQVVDACLALFREQHYNFKT